jgi:hypothetical protein
MRLMHITATIDETRSCCRFRKHHIRWDAMRSLPILSRAPHSLIAVAAIVLGAAILFYSAARSRLRALRMTTGETPE